MEEEGGGGCVGEVGGGRLGGGECAVGDGGDVGGGRGGGRVGGRRGGMELEEDKEG